MDGDRDVLATDRTRLIGDRRIGHKFPYVCQCRLIGDNLPMQTYWRHFSKIPYNLYKDILYRVPWRTGVRRTLRQMAAKEGHLATT